MAKQDKHGSQWVRDSLKRQYSAEYERSAGGSDLLNRIVRHANSVGITLEALERNRLAGNGSPPAESAGDLETSKTVEAQELSRRTWVDEQQQAWRLKQSKSETPQQVSENGGNDE